MSRDSTAYLSAGRCSECKTGLLFVYHGQGTYLVSSVPGGYYHRLGKGPLFCEGPPRIQTLRFNIHNTFEFQEGLMVKGVRSTIEYRTGVRFVVCPRSLTVCSLRDVYR